VEAAVKNGAAQPRRWWGRLPVGQAGGVAGQRRSPVVFAMTASLHMTGMRETVMMLLMLTGAGAGGGGDGNTGDRDDWAPSRTDRARDSGIEAAPGAAASQRRPGKEGLVLHQMLSGKDGIAEQRPGLDANHRQVPSHLLTLSRSLTHSLAHPLTHSHYTDLRRREADEELPVLRGRLAQRRGGGGGRRVGPGGP
jgi:hypothetical protein